MLAVVALPGDRDEDLRKKRLMLFTTLLKAAVCPFWYGAYFAVGAAPAAFGPLAFQILTLGSVGLFLRTSNFAAFRLRQQILILLAPIWIHVALGEFLTSSGVILWSFLAPLIAILFHGARQSLAWFLALLAVIVGLALFDPLLAPLAPSDRAMGATRLLRHELLRRHRHRLRRHPLLRGPAGRGEGGAGQAQPAPARLPPQRGGRDLGGDHGGGRHVRPGGLDEVGRRPDALGNLARLFQRMGVEVAARERRLREQVQLLTIKIDEGKKAAQVAEITEFGVFQRLAGTGTGSGIAPRRARPGLARPVKRRRFRREGAGWMRRQACLRS